MKNRSITYLLFGYICYMLFSLHSCNEIDDLQTDADQLKDRVAKLEEAITKVNASANSLQYLLSDKQIVGITPIDKGYKVEMSDGQTITVLSGEDVEHLLPLLSISEDGYWMYSMNGETSQYLLDPDGNPIKAFPTNSEGNPISSPLIRISTDGYWQVSYDGGQSYDYILDNGEKMPALPGTGSNSIFNTVKYDSETKELKVTLKTAPDTELSFPVIDTFYLNVKGTENEQVFPLSETRHYEVEQSDIEEATIQAPQGWKVTLSETELSITAPDKTDVERQETIRIIITSPKKYIRILPIRVKLLTSKYDATACLAWNEFITGAPDNVLLDFSYAGYKHGEVAPPDVYTLGYKVYNIKDYGAIPNDGKSDREAFIKLLEAMGATRGTDKDAIRYHMNSANAIIYFPPGEYILQGEGEKNTPLRLTMNNLIIKGAGRDKTTIKMAEANTQTDPDKMWSTPVMLELKNNGRKTSETQLSEVNQKAPKGSFKVTLASSTGIKSGDWVYLHMKSNNATLLAQELSPYTATAGMTNIKDGVEVYDYHQVKSVSGNTIEFVEPLMHEVDPELGTWEFHTYPHYENIGVEDLTFAGEAKEDFMHHRPNVDGADDGAYKIIDFVRLTNSWMRRINFVSVSEASSITSCANVSVYDVHIGGNRGHAAIRSQASSRVFIGKVIDESNGYEAIKDQTIGNVIIQGAGQYHGCGVSKQSLGAVIWKVQWGKDACFESHATQPRATLIDCCSGGFMPWRQGGDSNQMPNHLADLTIWNMNALNVKYDAAWGGKFKWWADGPWWKFLKPIVVGFHGTSINFDETQMIRNEAPGAPVSPYSLYEAQLRNRLNYVPAWLHSLQ